jgi:hypothetical protein
MSIADPVKNFQVSIVATLGSAPGSDQVIRCPLQRGKNNGSRFIPAFAPDDLDNSFY